MAWGGVGGDMDVELVFWGGVEVLWEGFWGFLKPHKLLMLKFRFWFHTFLLFYIFWGKGVWYFGGRMALGGRGINNRDGSW